MENFAYGEISERSFSNPRPWTVDGFDIVVMTSYRGRDEMSAILLT